MTVHKNHLKFNAAFFIPEISETQQTVEAESYWNCSRARRKRLSRVSEKSTSVSFSYKAPRMWKILSVSRDRAHGQILQDPTKKISRKTEVTERYFVTQWFCVKVKQDNFPHPHGENDT